MIQDPPLLNINLFWAPSLKQEGFSGKALSLTAENQLGKFDILPQHANFVTQIFNNLTLVTIDKNEHSYKFERGVLEVSEDLVRVFIGL